jgi:hypothetical protein
MLLEFWLRLVARFIDINSPILIGFGFVALYLPELKGISAPA